LEDLDMMRFLRFTKTIIAAAALGAAVSFAAPVAASADRWERHERHVWLPFPPPPPFFFPRFTYRDRYDHRHERWERNERWRDRYERRDDRHERHERWHR
jgi:hypothetical protein